MLVINLVVVMVTILIVGGVNADDLSGGAGLADIFVFGWASYFGDIIRTFDSCRPASL